MRPSPDRTERGEATVKPFLTHEPSSIKTSDSHLWNDLNPD